MDVKWKGITNSGSLEKMAERKIELINELSQGDY